MKSITLKLAGIALLTLGTFGCQSDPDLVKAPRTTVDDPLPRGAYPQVVLLDDLQKRIVASDLQVDKVQEIKMRVRLTLRSVTDRDLPIKYRFVFYAADGSEVDDPTWQSLSFAPRTERTLEDVASNSLAKKWRLEVKNY